MDAQLTHCHLLKAPLFPYCSTLTPLSFTEYIDLIFKLKFIEFSYVLDAVLRYLYESQYLIFHDNAMREVSSFFALL